MNIEEKKKDALDDYCDSRYQEFYIIDNNLKEIKNTESWGTSCILITDQDIEELKKGRLLVFCDGEYTNIVKYRKGE